MSPEMLSSMKKSFHSQDCILMQELASSLNTHSFPQLCSTIMGTKQYVTILLIFHHPLTCLLRSKEKIQMKIWAKQALKSVCRKTTKMEGRNVLGCKWVYKIKRKQDGSLDKYGIGYHDTFSPVISSKGLQTNIWDRL
jgi:hypothetical protein